MTGAGMTGGRIGGAPTKGWRSRAIAALLAISATLGAAAIAPAEEAAPPDDAQDLVFLGPLRPLLLRLNITIDGRPFREVWRAHVEDSFKSLDRDRDGALNADQLGPFTTLVGADGVAADALARDAAQSGGKLAFAPALACLVETAPPFVAQPGASATSRAPGLFPLLDQNGDRFLTKEELAAGPERLASRDFNDDDIVTEEELAADPANAGVDLAEVTATNAAPGDARRIGSMVAISNATQRAGAGAELLARYDRNADGRLALAGGSPEIVLAAPVALQLDRNADGALDGPELAGFAAREPDLTLAISLGRGRNRGAGRLPEADGLRVKRRSGDSGYTVTMADAEIDFRRDNVNPALRFDRQLYFSDYDSDGNQYLDQAEANAVEVVKNAFDAIDADADGKILPEEFRAHFDRQKQAAATRLVLEIVDKGQELFSLVDADSDGRLTPREARESDRLAEAKDANGDRRLGANEVPQKVRLDLARGTPALVQAAGRVARSRVRNGRAAGASNGPTWFVKMDRNADGDVSRREFLGPAAAFDKLDANRDGLIESREAETASTP